jgi:hypothetical protein
MTSLAFKSHDDVTSQWKRRRQYHIIITILWRCNLFPGLVMKSDLSNIKIKEQIRLFPIGKERRTKMTLTMTGPRLAGRTNAFRNERGTHWCANYLDSTKIFLDLEAGKLVNIVTVICCCRRQNHGFVRNWAGRGIFPLKRTRFVAPLWTRQTDLWRKTLR